MIEDDLIDATWLTELIKGKCPRTEVLHRASLPDALSALAERPIDAIFISIRQDGDTPSVHQCREVVRRAGPRPVVALVNAAEMIRAFDIYTTGVKFIYRKHPIFRTAQIRKQEVRDKLGCTNGRGIRPKSEGN